MRFRISLVVMPMSTGYRAATARRWVRSVVCTLSVAGCAAHRAASPPPATPASGVPVYDGDVAIDPATGSVQARWRISIIRDGAVVDTVRLRLNRGFRVSAVAGPLVVSHTATTDGDEQLITVALAPGARSAPAVIDLAYAGVLVAPSDSINRISPGWVELALDSFWLPVFRGFDQAIIGRVRLRLPAGFRVAASADVQRLDDSTYRLDARVPLIDIPFSASPSLAAAESGGTRVHYTGVKPTLVDPLLRTAEACASYLNALYGGATPLPPRIMVLAPRGGPGYARKNYIVITGADTTPVGLGRFVCHELAHFWSSRANSSGPHNWMNEAFAEFVSAQYVRARIGEPAYDAIVTQWRTVGERHGPVWTDTTTRRPAAMISYRKAPYLLTRLEARVGRDRMRRVLRRYMTAPIRTTPELIAMIGEVADRDTAAWFQDLLSASPPSSP